MRKVLTILALSAMTMTSFAFDGGSTTEEIKTAISESIGSPDQCYEEQTVFIQFSLTTDNRVQLHTIKGESNILVDFVETKLANSLLDLEQVEEPKKWYNLELVFKCE